MFEFVVVSSSGSISGSRVEAPLNIYLIFIRSFNSLPLEAVSKGGLLLEALLSNSRMNFEVALTELRLSARNRFVSSTAKASSSSV